MSLMLFPSMVVLFHGYPFSRLSSFKVVFFHGCPIPRFSTPMVDLFHGRPLPRLFSSKVVLSPVHIFQFFPRVKTLRLKHCRACLLLMSSTYSVVLFFRCLPSSVILIFRLRLPSLLIFLPHQTTVPTTAPHLPLIIPDLPASYPPTITTTGPDSSSETVFTSVANSLHFLRLSTD